VASIADWEGDIEIITFVTLFCLSEVPWKLLRKGVKSVDKGGAHLIYEKVAGSCGPCVLVWWNLL
jgi:hypothetical protein